MHFPLLSLIIFIPLIAGILTWLIPWKNQSAPKAIALSGALLDLFLAIILYAGYHPTGAAWQFVERADWVPALGISYHIGVNGLSVPLVMMATLVLTAGVMVSWDVTDQPREFFGFMMLLGSSVLGVFCSLDLFLLFFFFELAVFPKYLMIAIWGSPRTRDYGAMKLTLYLFLGSVVSLVGVLAMYFAAGMNTFDMLALEKAGFPFAFQYIWFPVVFIGFAILGGIFPFHSWAPDGHVAAPTAISMLLAGVEMKVGVFAALRVAFMLLPDGARQWAWAIMILGVINVVYGALIALVQSDFKYVIGFSSVSHMGLVLIGLATLNREGLLGAGMQMFSHGIMTAMFFAVVGMVYDRAHTRQIGELGGLFAQMPVAAVGFIIAGLVSMGMPGFSGFAAEFPIFMGAWKAAPWAAIIGILGVIITAGYILLVIRRVFFGEMPSAISRGMTDVGALDKLVIGVLGLVMLLMGLFPSLISPYIEAGMKPLLALTGGM